MTDKSRPFLIMTVDDDPALLRSVGYLLRGEGHEVVACNSGDEALELLETVRPDLILLDIAMPGMNGYEVCGEIRNREDLADLPVVFVTAQIGEGDKQRAFAAGGTGYIEKPFESVPFLTAVDGFLKGTHTLVVLPSTQTKAKGNNRGRDTLPPFSEFAFWLLNNLPSGAAEGLAPAAHPGVLLEWAGVASLGGTELARRMAEFTGLPILHRIDPEDLELGMLPRRFSLSRLVLPVRSRAGKAGLIMSNPFDWELWEALEHTPFRGADPDILIASSETIRKVFDYASSGSGEEARGPGRGSARGSAGGSVAGSAASWPPSATPSPVPDPEEAEEVQEVGSSMGSGAMSGDRDPGREHPVAKLAVAVLETAVRERASDIHIEPKPNKTLIRGRVDGDMVDLQEVPSAVASMLVSRFKALAGMDIAEKRKPQDGGLEVKVDGRSFKLRLATTSTPHGESLVIRLLEPTADPKTLEELGMTEEQESTLRDLGNRNQGLVLLVGPTGSGKSTTIYSLLSQVDTRQRSLMSVEDPVEYRIAFANQQQVNVEAGVTFESLLRSAVRQDPDILLLGEMRDLFSAKASMDFASSGHLTITTMHSSNSTTAIFRLERLGCSRVDMSEALIGVVAQKLIKRLCEGCKVVRDITPEERLMLEPYTDDIPSQVADADGCPRCRHTGFYGREGVYEILRFDAALAELVRSGAPIAEIRRHARARGDFFISDHGLAKIRDHLVPVKMVYEKVLVEETVPRKAPSKTPLVVTADPIVAPAALAPLSVAPPAVAPPAVVSVMEGSPQASPEPDLSRSILPAGALPGGGKIGARILVVDDDPDIRALLQRFLTGAGYEVLLAEDGVNALLKLGSQPIDLILSDINMPNLDGLKLLEIVNQHGTKASVVFLSAERDPAIELQGLELGAADFIHKPIQKDVVLLRIRRVLGGRVLGG